MLCITCKINSKQSNCHSAINRANSQELYTFEVLFLNSCITDYDVLLCQLHTENISNQTALNLLKR